MHIKRLALLITVGVSLLNSNAQAKDFIVDSVLDTPDANLADGLCKTAENICTLRAAVSQANQLAGADTIKLDAKVYILSGAAGDNANLSGDLDVTDDLTIVGLGARLTSIEGSGTDRVIHAINTKIKLEDLAIKKGSLGVDQDGAGIFNVDGDLILNRIWVTENVFTSGTGAGLRSVGKLTIESSTVSGNGQNTAGTGGGISNSGSLGGTINNSTISGNNANDAVGLANSSDLPLIITNSTIILNQAGSGQAGLDINQGSVELRNTIVAKNLNDGVVCVDINHNAISQGFNLIGIDDCDFATLPSDIAGTKQSPLDPKLGPLQDNGGPTDTHALLNGSPAIGKGDVANCPDTDQRGFKHPDGTCDIGAFQTGCGDGIKQGTEECDDGNLVDGDNCSATCEIESNGSGTGGDSGGCELNTQEVSSQSSIFALIGFLTLGILGLSALRFSQKR